MPRIAGAVGDRWRRRRALAGRDSEEGEEGQFKGAEGVGRGLPEERRPHHGPCRAGAAVERAVAPCRLCIDAGLGLSVGGRQTEAERRANALGAELRRVLRASADRGQRSAWRGAGCGKGGKKCGEKKGRKVDRHFGSDASCFDAILTAHRTVRAVRLVWVGEREAAPMLRTRSRMQKTLRTGERARDSDATTLRSARTWTPGVRSAPLLQTLL